MQKSEEYRGSEVENIGFSSSFLIHFECCVIKLKCDRGEGRGSLTKAKTTKSRPVREGASERGGDSVLKPGEGVSALFLRDHCDRLHGASVNDPPKWMG
ncbi:hypothetical protein AVEN_109020-1 [Araneus ventricosus]|uniref:Uncharacterized protein n=1 Tax=Araneus ventricosus TaxID=182803 RepID=A0A4Y2HMH7_ARAVE|nr:hypothetical protein AVEN_109020-1 [Araneus ventricosus]